MIQINLIPDALLKRRQEAKTRQTVTQLFIVWIGLLLAVVVMVLGWKLIQNARLNMAKNNYNKVYADVNSPENVKFRKEALEVQASLSSLDKLFNKQKKYSAINNRIAELMPKVDVLQKLSVDNTTISITGSANSYTDVGKFVASLKNTTPANNNSDAQKKLIYFDNVVLASASASLNGVSFTITADYTYPEGGVSE